MNYIIREIRREDNTMVEKIIRDCHIEYGGDHEGTAWADPDLCRFSEVYRKRGRRYFICENENGDVVGGAGIGEIEGADGVCELQKMYCIPDVRGTGCAILLLDAALGFAKEHYEKCYLETLPNMVRAQKFYEKHGFVRTSKTLCGGEHFACDVRYIKTLTSQPHNIQGGTVMNKEYSPLTRSQNFSVNFYNDGEVSDDKLKFAVICARYNGKWIFSRHKARETWEIPGGHREDGERIEDTATRELWEETGAVNADIRKVAVYGVEKDGKESYGTLFFADIKRIGNLPDGSEIGEIEMFDTLPKELTYPDIQPYLFNHVQGWLNIQSGVGETWDVYDENRNLTGKLHRRGDLLKDGEYHLVVHAWLMNSRGEFLLTKRTSNKGFPNMWEMTGGSALAGDDSITAAVREVKEETGLTADPARAERIFTFKRKDSFVDVWLFRQDFDPHDVVLKEDETCDKMYAGKAKLKELYDNGDFVPCPYIDRIMDI